MPEKAAKWSAELADFMKAGVLPPGRAAKIVGKLSFANQVAHGRFGRAFLRPLIRCIHAPLPGNKISRWTSRIIEWWIYTLRSTAIEWQIVRVKSPPPHSRSVGGRFSAPVCDRNIVVSWTDAASSTNILSAVFYNRGQVQYARMVAPPVVMSEFLQRGDKMIGVLELLAVLMVAETWRDDISSARWEAYIDNNGVLFSIINASCKAQDVNLIVGKFWRGLHGTSTDLTAFRVESKANIGDAGSRIEDEEELHDLKRLDAKFVNPRLFFLYNIFILSFRYKLKYASAYIYH